MFGYGKLEHKHTQNKWSVSMIAKANIKRINFPNLLVV